MGAAAAHCSDLIAGHLERANDSVLCHLAGFILFGAMSRRFNCEVWGVVRGDGRRDWERSTASLDQISLWCFSTRRGFASASLFKPSTIEKSLQILPCQVDTAKARSRQLLR